MDPNDNQPLNPDYLNQIAPQSVNNNGLFSQKTLMLGGLALAGVLVIFFVLMIFSSLSGSGDLTQRLAIRMKTTASTVELATPKIKSTKLRALNSNLKSNLLTIDNEFGPILLAQKIDIKKIDKKIISSESNDEAIARLEDARLNAVYDRTYAREMAYQLNNTIVLMKQIMSKTGKKDMKAFLQKSLVTLETSQKEFADFNASES